MLRLRDRPAPGASLGGSALDPERSGGELFEPLRARPYLTLAGLFAIGWVIGRGMTVRALIALAGIGARAAVVTAVEGALRERRRASTDARE